MAIGTKSSIWSTDPVATNVLEPLPVPADLQEGRTGPQSPAGGARAAAAVLSPAVAALAALAVHEFLPNRQLLPLSMGWLDDIPAWGRPYPAVLESLLAVSVLLAAAQSVGRPLRPWVRHHAPLLAGALGLFTLWDLITLKLHWMELPYFPGPGAVFAGMFEDRQLLLESTRHSLLLLLTGYGVGVAAGLVSGVLIGWFRRVRYWGHYPVADVEFELDCPISVVLRAWSPFLPGDVAASNVPGALFEVHLRNGSERPLNGTLATTAVRS